MKRHLVNTIEDLVRFYIEAAVKLYPNIDWSPSHAEAFSVGFTWGLRYGTDFHQDLASLPRGVLKPLPTDP